MIFEEHYKAFEGDTGLVQLLGLTITSIEEGSVSGEIILDHRHLNPMGTIHGGTIFSLMDTLATAAACTRGSYATTSSASVQYLNCSQRTKKLLGVTKEIKTGKSLMVHEVEVFDDHNQLLAKSTITNFRLSPIKQEDENEADKVV